MAHTKTSGHGHITLKPSGNLKDGVRDPYEAYKEKIIAEGEQIDAQERLKNPEFKGVRALGEEFLAYLGQQMKDMSFNERCSLMNILKRDVMGSTNRPSQRRKRKGK
jgi:hypothetical protein